MNDRTFAIALMAEWHLQQLDRLPQRGPVRVERTRRYLHGRCPRSECGAPMTHWMRGSRDGERWRCCTVCDYREIVRFDEQQYGRVLAAKARQKGSTDDR